MLGPDSVGQAGRAAAAAKREELFRCPICDSYIRKKEGFTCPKCNRGPLCRTHRVAGKKECTSCVLEMQFEELRNLRNQEQSIKNFLKLLQFFFLVFAVIFIAQKTNISETIEFLKYSIITDSITLLGCISVAGNVLFYLIMYNQRLKIRQLESGMNRGDLRRRVK